IVREATLFISASIATTANAVCHAVREIEAWIEEHPEDAAKRTDDDFLTRALNESLRLHQSGWMVRTAVRETDLPSSERVGEGESVWLDFRSAYRELFPGDPERF